MAKKKGTRTEYMSPFFFWSAHIQSDFTTFCARKGPFGVGKMLAEIDLYLIFPSTVMAEGTRSGMVSMRMGSFFSDRIPK